MANFQFFVHQTAGIMQDVAGTLNFPLGGFYALKDAERFAKMVKDNLNMTAIYDEAGRLVKFVK